MEEGFILKKVRFKIGFAVLAIGALLAATVTVGAVLAQESAGGEDTAAKTFIGRVAAILGLEEAKVEDAFQQVRKDQQTEAYKEILDRRVEMGRITLEEAEEHYRWFQSRPDSVTGSFGHTRSFMGRNPGNFLPRHGGRWDRAFSRWSKRHAQEPEQQEVTPDESATQPAENSQ
jgi:hypothetical protein